MEHRSWSPEGASAPGWTDAEMRDLAKPTILLVEDDSDVRDLLVTLLELAGFQTCACGTAEAALEQLRESPFDVVLTDYCLPHRTGGWLLQQASAEGLLDATPAMVVTAHPAPIDAAGFEVICKPFDLDDLVARVRMRLDGNRAPSGSRKGTGTDERKSQGSDDGRGGDGNGGEGGCSDPIELILYVNTDSPRSSTAIEKLRTALSRFQSARVSLTICDLPRNPSGGDGPNLEVTPALPRAPGPRTFILGHLTNPALLLELLEGCEES